MKIVWGALVTDGSGKLGGHVAAKNRAGSYLRTKVKPANAQTAAQMAARNSLATYAQAWRGLTEDQRLSWNNAVGNFPVVKNGKTIFLSGEQLYIQLNVNLALAGGSAIDTAPLPEEIPALTLTSLACDVSSMTFTITSDNATVPMGFALVVDATPNVSPGRYNVSNKFANIGLATLAMNTDNMWTEYLAKYGTPVAGQKVFARGYLVSTTTGQAGVPTTVSTIVSA